MTQALHCQVCGEFIDTVLTDKEITTYHKECDVTRQQELINVARGRQWRKLKGSESTEYSEDLNTEEGKYNNYD